MNLSERRQLNKALSIGFKTVGKKLAKDVVLKDKVLKAGTVINFEDIYNLVENHIHTVSITSEVGEFTVITNSFINPKILIKDGIITEKQIPEIFIDKDSDEISIEDTNIETLQVTDIKAIKYHSINEVEFNKLLTEIAEDQSKDLSNLMEVNANKLLGLTMTEEDIKAIINSYSLFSVGVYEPDDRDNLDFKRVLGISELFTMLLYDRIYGTFGYMGSSSIVNKYKSIMSNVNISKDENKSVTVIKEFGVDPFEVDTTSISNVITKAPLDMLFQVESNISPQEEISVKRKVTKQDIDKNIRGISSQSSDPAPRGVKPSHMGRLCCIESPEGGSVGLVLHLATYARVNRDGLIEAPYFKVDKVNKKIDYSKIYYMLPHEEDRYIRSVGATICNDNLSKIQFLKDSIEVSETKVIPIWQRVGGQVQLINKNGIEEQALIEFNHLKSKGLADNYKIIIRRKDWFQDTIVDAFKGHGDMIKTECDLVDFVAVSPRQITSLTSGTIPLNGYSDGTRQLMGSQMQKQAEPVLGSEPCLLRSNVVDGVAKFTGAVKRAPYDCIVQDVNSDYIKISPIDELDSTEIIEIGDIENTSERVLIKFKPVVEEGQYVMKGGLLADSTSTDNGEVKFGANLLIGYMIAEGYNYEDGIVINSRLVEEDVMTSFRSETYTMIINEDDITPEEYEALESKTKSKYPLSVKIGDKVELGQTLLCKYVLKRSVRGKVSSSNGKDTYSYGRNDYRDEQVKYTQEQTGVVVDIIEKVEKVTSKTDITKKVERRQIDVVVATEERISLGDKMSGRYGNKGVIGKIVPSHEMYRLADGTPLDVLLTPLGIPSRMNIGQIVECPLGLILKELNLRAVCMTGEKIDMPKTKKLIQDYIGDEGKMYVYSGVTGERTNRPIVVGVSTFGKLKHLSSHKLVVRGGKATSYSSYNQPLQGKRNQGGQKIGEMEMDSLQAHGAEYLLKELMAKSDDKGNRLRRERENQIEDLNLRKMKANNEPVYLNVSEGYRQVVNIQRAIGMNIRFFDGDTEIDINKNRYICDKVIDPRMEFTNNQAVDAYKGTLGEANVRKESSEMDIDLGAFDIFGIGGDNDVEIAEPSIEINVQNSNNEQDDDIDLEYKLAEITGSVEKHNLEEELKNYNKDAGGVDYLGMNESLEKANAELKALSDIDENSEYEVLEDDIEADNIWENEEIKPSKNIIETTSIDDEFGFDLGYGEDIFNSMDDFDDSGFGDEEGVYDDDLISVNEE